MNLLNIFTGIFPCSSIFVILCCVCCLLTYNAIHWPCTPLFLQNLVEESIWPMLAKESLKALGGLGLLSLAGKFLLRRVFEVCFLFTYWGPKTPSYLKGNNLVCLIRLLQKQEAQRLLLLSAYLLLLGLLFSPGSWASVIRLDIVTSAWRIVGIDIFSFDLLIKFDQTAAWSFFRWGTISRNKFPDTDWSWYKAI